MRKSNRVYLIIIFLFVSISMTMPGTLQAGKVSFKGLAKKINLFLEKTYPANEPGAAVLAVKDGKIILRKGYGMANLELGIPIKPEMVFRIGSITKQFTAVAIMKLAEEGKLSINDDITKYLKDYPTHGHKITIHHLLNLVSRQLRKDRQRQSLARSRFRVWEVALTIIEILEALLQVKGPWVVDRAADLLLTQVLLQVVPLLHADHELVVDVPACATFQDLHRLGHEFCFREQMVV